MSERISISIRCLFEVFYLRQPGTGIGALIVFALISSGCGPRASEDPSNLDSDRHVLGWSTSQVGLDTGSGMAFTPRIAVEQDPADNDGGGPDDSASSAIAVWVEYIDLDPGDFLPAVYHLYASRWNGTSWGPAVVVDTGSLDFHAWAPQISMDKTGSAVVVWQQHDDTAQRVYARRYVMGAGWDLTAKRLNDTPEFSDLDAASPSIAVEPDDGGSAMAVWLQNSRSDWQQIFEAAARPSRNPAAAAGANWTNPTAIFTSNGTYAVYNNNLQDGLCITDFTMAITAGAVVTGIIVQVEGNGSSAAAVDRQFRVSLTKTGCTSVGTAKTGLTLGQTVDTGVSIGNTNDLWGATWTSTELNAASFGVLISDNDATAAALNIDHVSVTVITSGLQCPGGAGNLCSSVNAMAVYNGRLYAGMGDQVDGSADVYVLDSGVWSISLNGMALDPADDQADGIRSMAVHNGKLYAGIGDVHTTESFGDLRVYDGTAWTSLITNDLKQKITLNSNDYYNAVSAMGSFNGRLYIGMGTNGAHGDGDVYRCTACDGTDWQTVLDNPANSFSNVTAMIVYNNQLYIGLQGVQAATGAAVMRCGVCDGTDWQTVLTTGAPYDLVRSMAVHNGLIYIGLEDIFPGTTKGDVLRCDAATTGCDATADWNLATPVFVGAPGGYESVSAMLSHDGSLYIGLGDDTGDGDIKRCRVCDGSDWSDSRNDGSAPFTPAAYEAVLSMVDYQGYLHAGFGSSNNTDGDIFRLSTGWHTTARRFSGVWDTTDALCPANSGANDGICFISGGPTFAPTENPVVAMDDTGRATAAFIRFDTVPCNQGGGTASDYNTVINIIIFCKAGRIYATRFNLTTWSVPENLTPPQNIDDPGEFIDPADNIINVVNENCEDWGDTVFRQENETADLSSACLSVSDLHLSMDSDPSNLPTEGGNAVVAFKIFERALLSNSDVAPPGGNSNPNSQPPLDLLDAHERKAVFVRRYSGSTGSWDLSALTGIADYEYSPSVLDATTPTNSDCASLTDADANEDNVMIMNCDLASLALAVKPNDGTRAMVAYERYVGPVYDIFGNLITAPVRDIVVHRHDGTAFGIISDADNCSNTVLTCWHNVDAGAGEAHAPGLAMDNAGNAILVWTQKDGSGVWHVYANRCAENAGSCAWSGAAIIDSNSPGENYYEPYVGVEAVSGNAVSLVNAMDALFGFRIDAFRWTPP